MIGIRTTIGSWCGQWWPNRRSAADATERRDDVFVRSVAELSRLASERVALQSAAGPAAAAQARRAALLAYDRARARRLRWAIGFVVGVVAGTGIAALVATINAPAPPELAGAAAPAEPMPAVDVASLGPKDSPVQDTSPQPAEPAQAAAVVADDLVPAAVAPSALMPNAMPSALMPNPMTPEANEPQLKREEVRELQARLRSFGFNPGPVDGIAGQATERAALRYQQERAQPQTGKVDRALLEQLRQDPSPQARPQVAQRVTRPEPRVARPSPSARSADPLQPVKDGFDRVGRWIDSLVR